MQNVLIYLEVMNAGVLKDLQDRQKQNVLISTNVGDQMHVESTLGVSTYLDHINVFVQMDLLDKEIYFAKVSGLLINLHVH